MCAHAISERVLKSAQSALSTAARSSERFKSTTYSALIASLVYEELNNELRRTQADEVDKHRILIQAIEWCRDIAGSPPAQAVEMLRTLLKLLETGRPPQADLTPLDRRARFRVVQGKLSSLMKPIVTPRHLREIG